jgi:glycerol-3-phosphate cytidylyltransferase-like family protein
LVVALASDDAIAIERPCFLDEMSRASVLMAIRGVSAVLTSDDLAATIRELRPDVLAKGREWDGSKKSLADDILRACRECHTAIVYTPTMIDSSSRRLRTYTQRVETNAFSCWMQHLEDTPTTPESFGADYFTAAWRHGRNYTLEQRRQIEGRHPRLIRETFRIDGSMSVLDAGCGPGHLVTLLAEEGVVADGLDWLPRPPHFPPASEYYSLDLAAPGRCDVPPHTVVICREVLEHLSLAQLLSAFANLVRATTRYLYITTRVHPDPWHVLDITDDKATDPTHVTCVTGRLLRLLGAIHGLRERTDLAANLDWQQKGRCFVWERT